MKAMNEWKRKQDEKNKLADKKAAPTTTKSTYEVEESGASSVMSVGGKKAENVVESYTSDDFEDTSMSGSGSASNSGLIPKLVKPAAVKPASTLKKIEESSDVYEDDDFESLSRSQQ
jgi:hypothetical protein